MRQFKSSDSILFHRNLSLIQLCSLNHLIWFLFIWSVLIILSSFMFCFLFFELLFKNLKFYFAFVICFKFDLNRWEVAFFVTTLFSKSFYLVSVSVQCPDNFINCFCYVIVQCMCFLQNPFGFYCFFLFVSVQFWLLFCSLVWSSCEPLRGIVLSRNFIP